MNLRPQTRLSLAVGALVLTGLASFVVLLQMPVVSVPLLLALALYYLLDPWIVRLERRGYSRRLAIAVFGTGFLLATALVAGILPDWVSQQFRLLRSQGDAGIDHLRSGLESLEWQIRQAAPFLGPVDLASGLDSRAAILRDRILEDAPGAIVQSVIAAILVPLFTFFLLRDGRRAQKATLALIPNRHFEMTLNILYRMNQQVGAYLRGVLLEAILVGLTAFLALLAGATLTGMIHSALPVPGIAFIATVVAITNLIPYFGPIAGGSVGALYLLFTVPTQEALIITLLVLTAGVVTAQLTDNVLIGPLVLGRAVNVHPVAVVILLIVFGRVFGLLGLVVAVPLWAVLRVVLVETVEAVRAYGRHVVEPGRPQT